jgi:hypothetical protein
MREALSKCVIVMGAGLAMVLAQGCKKHAAPVAVQPVVRNVPRVQPDFAVGSLPVEDVDRGAMPRVDRTPRRQQPVQPMQAQNTDAQAAAANALVQRRQDVRLLQEQEAASQRQQQELNQEIEEDTRTQQQMEAEPRIQDIPEAPQPMQPQ